MRTRNIAILIAIILITAILVCTEANAGTTQACPYVDLDEVQTGDACYRADGTHILFEVIE